MTKQEYEAAVKYAMDTDRPPWQDIAVHQAKNNYIASLEVENANLKADNRSLVEQANKMALQPNQEVIEWHNHPEEKPEKTGYYIIYYTILNRVAFDFWHNDIQEWDKYGEYMLGWACLPKGGKYEEQG